jgi:hypothetical protein
MRITETARKNHEELFPNRTSTLMVTDPELIEVFDNFALNAIRCLNEVVPEQSSDVLTSYERRNQWSTFDLDQLE